MKVATPEGPVLDELLVRLSHACSEARARADGIIESVRHLARCADDDNQGGWRRLAAWRNMHSQRRHDFAIGGVQGSAMRRRWYGRSAFIFSGPRASGRRTGSSTTYP